MELKTLRGFIMGNLTRTVSKQVEKTRTIEKTIIEKDENGNDVSRATQEEEKYMVIEPVIETLSDKEEAEIIAEWKKNESISKDTEYLRNRIKEYPKMEDQLDFIYHNGLDAWKSMISEIKNKYPKPN